MFLRSKSEDLLLNLTKFSQTRGEKFMDKSKGTLMEEIPPVNLLVGGKNGVGKMTLMNTMFCRPIGEVRVGSPVTAGIEKHEIPGFPFRVYEVQGFEFSKTEDIMKAIHDKITDDKVFQDQKYMIHAIFYCIAHVGNRIEVEEERFIKELSAKYKVPIFLVFTKAFMVDENNISDDEFIKAVKSKNLPVVGYYPVLCEKYKNKKFDIEPFGTEKLLDDFFDKIVPLMKEYKDVLDNVKRQIQHERAVKWVWEYAAGNFASGAAIPADTDVFVLDIVEAAMVAPLVNILYKGEDKSKRDNIISGVSACVSPLLRSFEGQSIFSELSKAISYVMAGLTFGRAAAMVVATQVVGGIAVACITVAMGKTLISIIEDIISQKIKETDIDVVGYTKQLKEYYEEAKVQAKNEKRFSSDKFSNLSK